MVERKNLKNQLKAILIKYSYENREVTLASGKKSNFYFDGKQTSLHPEGAHLISELFYELMLEKYPDVEAVGGPTLGADPLATALSLKSYLRENPKPAFIVRKKPKGHGTEAWIEGVKHLKPGMKVLMLEDVVTTAGSILQAIEKVQDFGLEVAAVFVLVDRQEGGRERLAEKGIELESLFTKSDFT